MTLVRQDTGWIDEIKNYLQSGVLPEENAEAERVARPAAMAVATMELKHIPRGENQEADELAR